MKIVYLISKKIKTYICVMVSLLVFCLLLIININYFQDYNTLETNIQDNQSVNDANSNSSMLAIVIENFGYEMDGADELMSIKRHLTFSVTEFDTQAFAASTLYIDGTGKTKDYIKTRLKAAANMAQLSGSAVAIGHVGKQGGKLTFQAIKEMLSYFDSNKIQLVFISEIYK